MRHSRNLSVLSQYIGRMTPQPFSTKIKKISKITSFSLEKGKCKTHVTITLKGFTHVLDIFRRPKKSLFFYVFALMVIKKPSGNPVRRPNAAIFTIKILTKRAGRFIYTSTLCRICCTNQGRALEKID
jgi:hypothetical protein